MSEREDTWRRESASRHYGLYADYAGKLRAWLVAYGIGGRPLFINPDTLFSKLLLSQQTFSIIVIIVISLFGVFSQFIFGGPCI